MINHQNNIGLVFEAVRVANLATLSLDLATIILKRLATNLATFGQTLATFQMSPVLSCEREILSYTSPWPRTHCSYIRLSVHLLLLNRVLYTHNSLKYGSDNRINSRKIQVVTTAFTEILRSVYGTEPNN